MLDRRAADDPNAGEPVPEAFAAAYIPFEPPYEPTAHQKDYERAIHTIVPAGFGASKLYGSGPGNVEAEKGPHVLASVNANRQASMACGVSGARPFIIIDHVSTALLKLSSTSAGAKTDFLRFLFPTLTDAKLKHISCYAQRMTTWITVTRATSGTHNVIFIPNALVLMRIMEPRHSVLADVMYEFLREGIDKIAIVGRYNKVYMTDPENSDKIRLFKEEFKVRCH